MHTKHHCPACGARLVLETDYDSGRASVPWYKLAPVKNHCASCRTQVEAVVPNIALVAVALLVSAALICIVVLNILESSGAISSTTFDNMLFVLVVLVALGGNLGTRFLWRYQISANA
jgi:hypothetical protein